MRIHITVILLCLVCVSFQGSLSAQQEEIKLVSYYPAPFGEYNELRVGGQIWVGKDAGGNMLKGGTPLLQIGGIDPSSDNCSVYVESPGNYSSVFGRNTDYGIGVEGESNTGIGVYGKAVSLGGTGVEGYCRDGTGVRGDSDSGAGVYGYSYTASADSGGVYGRDDNANSNGVYGYSESGTGVTGRGGKYGVIGRGGSIAAVFGQTVGNSGDAVRAFAYGTSSYGLNAYSKYKNAVYAKVPPENPNPAGYFEGDLKVTKRAYLTIPNIPVFANTAARDAAIPSPVEGDFIYNKSAGKFQIYVTGSGWVDEY